MGSITNKIKLYIKEKWVIENYKLKIERTEEVLFLVFFLVSVELVDVKGVVFEEVIFWHFLISVIEA